MKSLLLIFFLAFCFLIFSQEGENPWIKVENENPWKVENTNPNPWTLSEDENLSQNDSLKIDQKDSIGEFAEIIIIDKNQTLNKDLNLSLWEIKARSKENFNGRNAFLSGFIPCALFSFYAVIPVAIANVIPSSNETDALNKFKLKNPKANSDQIKAFKKGIKSKRVSKSMSGAGYGMLTNLVGIIVIFIIALSNL
jgi:hypothetical protein